MDFPFVTHKGEDINEIHDRDELFALTQSTDFAELIKRGYGFYTPLQNVMVGDSVKVKVGTSNGSGTVEAISFEKSEPCYKVRLDWMDKAMKKRCPNDNFVWANRLELL